MPFRSKKDAETKTDNSVDLLTSEEPVIAGRFEWMTTATRDQLADMAGRSKSLAGTARTRVTPLAEIPSKRFRASREQIVVAAPEPEEKSSSTAWLLIAIIAAVASAIVAIVVQRARQRAVEEHEIDLLMEGDVLSPEQPLIHHHQDYDNVAVNPS
jgi:hypothetical protein